jgi:hypothetical protein
LRKLKGTTAGSFDSAALRGSNQTARFRWRKGGNGCEFPSMTKREFSAGFVAICLWVAPHICRAQEFAEENLALNNPALFPADTAALLSSAPLSNPISFAWMMPEEAALPSSSNLVATRTLSAPVNSDKHLSDRLSEIVPKFDYATGEIGFMYGRSIGKHGGGDFKQGYIMGEAGNDKTQVFVGASYEDSSFRLPRFGR